MTKLSSLELQRKFNLTNLEANIYSVMLKGGSVSDSLHWFTQVLHIGYNGLVSKGLIIKVEGCQNYKLV